MSVRSAGVAAALALAGCAAIPGDPERGRLVFLEREQGHCVLCHAAPGIAVAGNVGPSLAGVGLRLSAEEIRVRVEDITRVNAQSAMPAYSRAGQFARVAPAYAGRSLLTAEQVDDVVAWLSTLR